MTGPGARLETPTSTGRNDTGHARGLGLLAPQVSLWCESHHRVVRKNQKHYAERSCGGPLTSAARGPMVACLPVHRREAGQSIGWYPVRVGYLVRYQNCGVLSYWVRFSNAVGVVAEIGGLVGVPNTTLNLDLNVGVAPTFSPEADSIVTLCGSEDLFVKSIAIVPDLMLGQKSCPTKTRSKRDASASGR